MNQRKSSLPIRDKDKHFKIFKEQAFDNSPTVSSFFFFFSKIDGQHDMEWRLCTTAQPFCLPIRNTFPRISSPCYKTKRPFSREISHNQITLELLQQRDETFTIYIHEKNIPKILSPEMMSVLPYQPNSTTSDWGFVLPDILMSITYTERIDLAFDARISIPKLCTFSILGPTELFQIVFLPLIQQLGDRTGLPQEERLIFVVWPRFRPLVSW